MSAPLSSTDKRNLLPLKKTGQLIATKLTFWPSMVLWEPRDNYKTAIICVFWAINSAFYAIVSGFFLLKDVNGWVRFVRWVSSCNAERWFGWCIMIRLPKRLMQVCISLHDMGKTGEWRVEISTERQVIGQNDLVLICTLPVSLLEIWFKANAVFLVHSMWIDCIFKILIILWTISRINRSSWRHAVRPNQLATKYCTPS